MYACFAKLRIELLQLRAAKNCFNCAKIGPGPNQRFISAFAEQKLQRADDDRFPRTGLSRDSDEPRAHLPLELFHKREIFYSQQGENGRHRGKSVVDG